MWFPEAYGKHKETVNWVKAHRLGFSLTTYLIDLELTFLSEHLRCEIDKAVTRQPWSRHDYRRFVRESKHGREQYDTAVTILIQD